MQPGKILLISDGSPVFPALSYCLTDAGHQGTTTEQTEEAFGSSAGSACATWWPIA